MKNEMSRRQFLGFAGSAAAVLGLGLVGCGGSAGSGSSASGDAAEVYFLQFKPEVDKEWKEIAKAYKKEKGVEVKIVTAASNTYEEKLKSEMSKSSAPTLFQVNGPTGLKNWKDYCADLSDTKLRGELIDDSLALQSDGKDLGIDWVQESYGIIYNKQLLEKAGYKAEPIRIMASRQYEFHYNMALVMAEQLKKAGDGAFIAQLDRERSGQNEPEGF